jgi:hypothetical protein
MLIKKTTKEKRMKHYLLKNEDDRWALCWQYLQFKCEDVKIWKDEDLPLLKPFFDYDNMRYKDQRLMTEEEGKSFDHYMKCRKEYADRLFEICDSVKHCREDNILLAFGYEHEEDIFEDDKECYCTNPLTATNKPSKNLLDLQYPVVAVIWIESDYDRIGKCGICCVDFVEKKEFEGA